MARSRRHNAIATVVATYALKADPRAFQVEREVGFDEDPSRARSGDVSLDLKDGRTLLDVTVANPFTAARIRASRNAGSPAVAAEEAFDKKVKKYADLFEVITDAGRLRFVPLSVTAAGVWDERSIRWLRKFSSVDRRGRTVVFRAAHGSPRDRSLKRQLSNASFVPDRELFGVG